MSVRRPASIGTTHITICFDEDGEARFYPEGDLHDCLERFARIVGVLHEHPSRLACALGLCAVAEGGVEHVH